MLCHVSLLEQWLGAKVIAYQASLSLSTLKTGRLLLSFLDSGSRRKCRRALEKLCARMLPWLAIHLPPCLFEHSFLGLQLASEMIKWSTFDDTLMTHCILRHIAAYCAAKQCGNADRRRLHIRLKDDQSLLHQAPLRQAKQQSSKANHTCQRVETCCNVLPKFV